MPISKPHSTLGASNKNSCTKLAVYLEKENNDLDKKLKPNHTIQELAYIEGRKQYFFSHSKQNISTNHVIEAIDSNIKKLGKNDSKYFAPTISFSQQELEHIVSLSSERTDINDVWDLNNEEFARYNQLLQQLIRLIMTNYAENFNRKNKGLKTGNNLVYFAKIEHFRRYKGTEKAVINGDFKTGELKPGLNTHAHIIVSRKDSTQKMKLDPTTKEKKTDRIINGNLYRVGFDRMKWTEANEKTFDKMFSYDRKHLEKFKSQYVLKNGSPEEKNVLLKNIEQSEKIKEQNLTFEKKSKREQKPRTPKL